MGAGAVGCFCGALLARAGHAVTLIGRPHHMDAIRARGLLLDSATFQGAVPVAATADPDGVAGADAILFCVKSNDTETAGRAIAPHLASNAAVLSFQNGVDSAERLQTVLGRPVIPVAVYVAAQMAGPGHIKHQGRGDLVLGPSPDSTRLADTFIAAGIPTDVSDAVREALWTKLVINCCYNALSAVPQITYRRMLSVPVVTDVMRDVIDECLAVARAAGVHLSGDPLQSILAIGEAMPEQTSSTAQDIARGKASEIEHLNGFIVRSGAAFGIPTPANRALYAMVKLVEAGREA